jgi:hypothetical protein
VLSQLPDHLVDTTLLVTWQLGTLETKSEKPLPFVESSKQFLCSYLELINNSKTAPTDAIIKGKLTLIDSGIPRLFMYLVG